MGSIRTSNDSVTGLSALTEELTATMQQVADNAAAINQNAESVRGEVSQIADRSNDINTYSLEMEEHASAMEAKARQNMISTEEKMEIILAKLNQAIEEQNKKTQRLEEYREYTKTREFTEEVARDQLGLVYPGEIILRAQ